MRKRTQQTGHAPELDFNSPTPRALRAKMVKKSDIMRRLRQEFQGVRMDTLNEYQGFRLLNFNADNVIVASRCGLSAKTGPTPQRSTPLKHGKAVERRVLSRARLLEKLAYFRNCDIKFGLCKAKGEWWQSAAVR